MEELVPPFYKADRSFGAEIASISGNVGAFLPSYLSNATAPWKIVSWNEVLETFRDSWINIQKPLTAGDLDGRLVILDFFTYCCINCMHVLPYLKRLESLFDEGSVRIIGVHSAKFINEKSSINVANAVSRYEIDHPVINDVDCLLWRKLGVQCWPTIVIVDPDGRLTFWFEGESRMLDLEDLIGRSLKYYRERGIVSSAASAKPTSTTVGEIVRSLDGLRMATPKSKAVQPSGLKFPGKLALSPSAQLLAISDSGHHRILIFDLCLGAARCASVVAVGQTGCSGAMDGAFSVARFHSPQGLCWMGEEILFVTDTENHLIRNIDMKHGTVSTVGGVGRQGQDLMGGNEGREQEISSPWDVVIVETELNSRSLLIAAAGTHQIWILPLTAAVSVGKRQYLPNRLYCFAGSGREAAKNNSYPHQAAFAQPSGLCVNGVPSSVVYVADSESSSIRVVDMKSGSVKNVVGGDKNPENLFAFGDVDGVGFDAKLQHPLAVAYCQQTGNVYIADSYNHKIKVVDPVTRACRSLALDFDNVEPKTLNEPSGICVAYPNLYIADTNNHRVLVVDMETLRAKQLQVVQVGDESKKASDCNASLETTDSSVSKSDSANSDGHQEVVALPPSAQRLRIRVCLDKSDYLELSDGAPHAWKISPLDAAVHLHLRSGVQNEDGKLSGDLRFVANEGTLPDLSVDARRDDSKLKAGRVLFRLELVAYLCNKKSGVCSVHSRKYDLMYCEEGDDKEEVCGDVVMTIDWKLS